MTAIKNLLKITKEVESEANLMTMSDIHYGNMYHNNRVFNIYVDWLHEHPKYDILLLGDLIEGATKESVGYYDQNINIDDQLDYIVETFQPFAKENRIWGMMEGNHERRAKKAAGLDITKILADRLNIPLLEKGCWFWIVVKTADGKEIYPAYATHGASGATTPGGRINAVTKLSNITEVELYLHAHLHTMLHHKEDIFSLRSGVLKEISRHYVVTGGYLDYVGSYAQEKSYTPNITLGSPKIKFHGKFHRLSVSL